MAQQTKENRVAHRNIYKILDGFKNEHVVNEVEMVQCAAGGHRRKRPQSGKNVYTTWKQMATGVNVHQVW